MSENWNNFPAISPGDKVKITWTEKYYGNQESGEAFAERGAVMVRFGEKTVSVDALRSNENIERTEVVKG